MSTVLIAATNDPTGSVAAGMFSHFNGHAVLFALGFTLVWDILELWIRYGSLRFFRTSHFLFYLLFHFALSALVVPLALRATPEAWLAGLLAATANETFLSNANISFGKANLVPLLEMFKQLRINMQTQLDKMQQAQDRLLLAEVKRLSVAVLEQEVKQVLVAEGMDLAAITQKLDGLKKACGDDLGLLATKLAHDLIQSNRVYVTDSLEKWQQDARRP